MSKNINSYQLGITGNNEIESPINTENYATVKGEISVYETRLKDNNDGSYDKIFKAKFTKGAEVEQGGKVIKGKDKRRKSVKLRHAIWRMGEAEGVEDREAFYDVVMDKVIYNLEDIWQEIKVK